MFTNTTEHVQIKRDKRDLMVNTNVVVQVCMYITVLNRSENSYKYGKHVSQLIVSITL